MKAEEQHTIVLPTVAPTGQSAQKPRLLVTAGPLEGREYLIARFPFTIGSGLSNDLSIADSTVSRHHCEIGTLADGTLTITDRGSTNGTSIEGVRVTSARLSPNTEIQLGRTRIVAPLVQDHPELTMSAREQFGHSLGRSALMRHVFHLAERAAQSESPVLLLGESGTGKEELAGGIHRESPRGEAPFIVVDCKTWASAEAAKTELFGSGDVPGALTLARGGSLFIDSIDLLPRDVQPRLLRALEAEGGRVRMLSATKENLSEMAKSGAFDRGLYLALAVIVIELPALRRRKDDIPLLLRAFAEGLGVKEELAAWTEQPSTLAFLKRYNWPGNVRELRALVERLNALERIPADLGAFLQGAAKEPEPVAAEEGPFQISADRPFKDMKNELIEDFERRYLSDLLARNAQNISQSARSAGIERAYLQRLIRKYGMRSGD